MARYLGVLVVAALAALMLVVFAPAAGRRPAASDVLLHRVAELREVSIPTFEGSGQAMHPDIMQNAPLLGGWEYRMSFTPYPGEAEATEDASVVVSHDGVHWEVEQGIVNPLSPHFAGLKTNSDPDYVYDVVDHRCLLFYRSVMEDNPVERLYVLTSSPSCRQWSTPKLLFSGPQYTLISPTVVMRPDHAAPMMWTVDSHGEGCGGRSSRVTMRQWVGDPREGLLNGRWMPPVVTDLAVPGRVVWHLDVNWSEELREYWALFPAFVPGQGCSSSDLFTAHSTDGVHWAVLTDPLVRRGDTTWTARTLYRSTAQWLPGRRMRVWFSAKGGDGRWRTGETTFQAAAPATPGAGAFAAPVQGPSRPRVYR